MIRIASLCLALVLLTGALGWTADDDTVKLKDDGYRGIWFTLGQFTDTPYGKGKWDRFWDYGDKYSGGLGTYTAKHVPIAVYAPEVNKTFFCYGGSKNGRPGSALTQAQFPE